MAQAARPLSSTQSSTSDSSSGGSGLPLSFTISREVLFLCKTWTTSHASSTSRTNALIRVLDGWNTGVGEVGLPPKNPSAGYLADYDDVEAFLSEYVAYCADKRDGLPKDDPTTIIKWYLQQLYCMEPAQVRSARTFGRCGVEMALLDLQSLYTNTPPNPLVLGMDPRPAYYTVSIDTPEEMAKGTVEALQLTPFIKLKMDGEESPIRARLTAIVKALGSTGRDVTLCIDANASWSPQLALSFLVWIQQLLKGTSVRLYILEQPFPTSFPLSAEWKEVAREYKAAGVLIVADESMAVSSDLQQLLPYVHGVNIKLEKAGGYRAAANLAQLAKEQGLIVWTGTMVGSAQICWQAVQLLPFSVAGDMDGYLLTTRESQSYPKPRFHWEKQTGTISSHPSKRIQMNIKK